MEYLSEMLALVLTLGAFTVLVLVCYWVVLLVKLLRRL